MKCCFCGKGMEENKNMFPLDPPKTPNRRWACTDCMSAEQIADIPQDVKELSYLICGDTKLKEEA